MKNQQLVAAIHHLATERGLPTETILEALESALVLAYRRNYGAPGGNIEAKVDAVTGEMRIYVEKRIVDQVTDDRTQITLRDARRLDPTSVLDTDIVVESTPDDFGRIAAQSAKQVMMQRIREAERDSTYERFSQREGEIVSGRVQRYVPRTGDVIVNIEQSEGLLSREDQLPNERYHRGSPVRAYLVEVSRGSRGTALKLSRTHRQMLRRLLEGQVPEVEKGIVEIKAIAREPGYRSKVAVTSLQPGVEPVGCCVGMRGSRIQHIVDELNGEKIDVIAWSADTRTFIRNALSPAKPLAVLLDEGDNGRTATVVVPDSQLSLSIGREGQNARLAAKLTGWRIDIKGETEAASDGLLALAQQQVLAEEERKRGLLEAVQDILSEGREAIEARLQQELVPVEGLTAAEAVVEAEGEGVVAAEAGAELQAVGEVAAAEVHVVEGPAELEAETVAPEPGIEEPSEPVVGETESEVPALRVELEGLDFEEEPDEEDEERVAERKSAKQQRDLRRRRQMIYDEDLGRTITVRRRKRDGTDWGREDEY